MAETAFEQTYPSSSRIAAVLAAKVVLQHGLPNDYRKDLTQEALLELWRKALMFDERRGSWRTFSERVVANKLASLLRRTHSGRAGYGLQDSIQGLQLPDTAGYDDIDLRTDVSRVLDTVSAFDRTVALLLIDDTVIETSRRLGIARATVNRSIVRLRAAFAAAGLCPAVLAR